MQTRAEVNGKNDKKNDGKNEKLLAAMAYIGFLAALILTVSWQLFIIVRMLGYVAFVFPVFMIIGIMNVVNGQEKELPVIGKIRLFR